MSGSEETENIRMPLTSHDVMGERVEQLKELFPEAFAEGKIDFDRLRNALGDFVGEGRERYGLSWAGKADAIRALQAPSVGTLLPCPDESVNWDTTENVFIEGDNLEVLKLLQKSYYGKVKMIYIDPPYNTGNEFIYPDNFKEGLDDYLKYSGQVDGEGVRQSTNAETSGRYHSNWLDMMYPRLFLARNLLSDNGILFVSIDDNELHNLRLLLDEIFGADNFVATLIWQKVYSPKNSARHFSEDHDYVVAYARDGQRWEHRRLPRTPEMEARYSNPDNDHRGPWKASDLSARNRYNDGVYPITTPSGREIDGPPRGRYWSISQVKLEELDADGRVWWGADGTNTPAIKRFLSELQGGRVPQTLLTYNEVGHTQEAKQELVRYVDFENTENVLNSVKPTRLIERLIQVATDPETEDIVLDFFAGSGVTGHAVAKQNLSDNGNRRFVLVQLPEKLPTPEPGLATIADMARKRLNSYVDECVAGQRDTLDGMKADRGISTLGHRTFRLTTSNFAVWEHDVDATKVTDQIRLFSKNTLEGREDRDLLYEIVLKSGLGLTGAISKVEDARGTIYSVLDGLICIFLGQEVTKELVRSVIEQTPQRFICLDRSFNGDDELKTNTVLEMKSYGIEFRTV